MLHDEVFQPVRFIKLALLPKPSHFLTPPPLGGATGVVLLVSVDGVTGTAADSVICEVSEVSIASELIRSVCSGAGRLRIIGGGVALASSSSTMWIGRVVVQGIVAGGGTLFLPDGLLRYRNWAGGIGGARCATDEGKFDSVALEGVPWLSEPDLLKSELRPRLRPRDCRPEMGGYWLLFVAGPASSRAPAVTTCPNPSTLLLRPLASAPTTLSSREELLPVFPVSEDRRKRLAA